MKTIYSLLLNNKDSHSSVSDGDLVAPGFEEHELLFHVIVPKPYDHRFERAIEKINRGDLEGFDDLNKFKDCPYFYYDTLVSYAQNLDLNLDVLRKSCLDVLYHTKSFNQAKYALILLTLVPKDEEIRDVVMLYEGDEEFSYYTTQVIASWSDGNQEFYQMMEAGEIFKGYYTIDYTLKVFEPVTKEMKTYLLLECPIYEYTVMEIFEKSGAFDLLVNKEELNDDVYHRMSTFIYMLTRKDSPLVGLGYYDEYLEILDAYIEASYTHNKIMKDYYGIGNALKYIENRRLERFIPHAAEFAHEMVYSEECQDLMNECLVMAGGFQAFEFAQIFHFEYIDTLADYIFKDLDERFYIILKLTWPQYREPDDENLLRLIPYMRSYEEKTGDYTVILLLKRILNEHPGAGEDLLKKCLNSDDEDKRKEAQDILEAWENVPIHLDA